MKEIEVKQETKRCSLLLALLLIFVTTQISFAQNIEITVTTTAEWNAALSTIQNGGGNQTYTITVSGNVSVSGSTSNNFGSVQNVEVTLKGSGTLSLSSNGSILNVGSNQTLTIDDENLTL